MNVEIETASSYDVLPPITNGFQPCHPHMVFYEDRLLTFNTWSKQLRPDKHSLSRGGLFYSQMSDICICAFCDLHLTDWSEEDNVFLEHSKHRSGCIYLHMIGYDINEAAVGKDIPPSNIFRTQQAVPQQTSPFPSIQPGAEGKSIFAPPQVTLAQQGQLFASPQVVSTISKQPTSAPFTASPLQRQFTNQNVFAAFPSKQFGNTNNAF